MIHHNTGRPVSACPACLSDDFEPVGAEASAFRCNGTGSVEHPAYHILECRVCSLCFKSCVLATEFLHSYYETLDFTPFDRNEGFPTDAALLKHLKRLSPGSKVLDFGCSTGRILAELGSAYERFGIEINEAAADRARGHGIAIISERDLRDGMTEKFDAIVLSDVFEHLLEPTKTLRLLTSRLATSGKLYIVTALSDTIRQRALIPEHWYFRIPGHLQMLSRDHLIWIAASLGLQMTSLDVMSHYRRDPIRFAKQRLQSLLYEKVKLAPRSVIAAVVRSTPSLNRVGKWTNLPMTDQLRDHAVAVLTNTR